MSSLRRKKITKECNVGVKSCAQPDEKLKKCLLLNGIKGDPRPQEVADSRAPVKASEGCGTSSRECVAVNKDGRAEPSNKLFYIRQLQG